MKREHTIPLFLWIALALCVHAITGGGADRVSEMFAERLDVRDFARDARGLARRVAPDISIDIETSLPEDEALPEEEPETKDAEKSEPEKDPEALALKEPEPEKKAPEPPKPPEAEKKKEIQLTEKKPAPAEPPKVEPPPVIVPDRRIAVKQHVDKPDQEDNPNARFAAEEANRVEKETQARITARDQNEKIPDPGKGPTVAPGDPGNSEESRVAESEERKGETGATDSAQASRATESGAAAPEQAPGAPRTPEQVREAKARAASDAEKAQTGAPEVASSDAGRDSVEMSRQARAGKQGQKELPSLKPKKPTDLLGLGSEARTSRGINLNLSPALANSIVGADNLAKLSKTQSEKRLSQHRGPWKSLGLERWRASIENYVPVVQPGNQTALNTARVPFANYLHEIHNKLHPIFADTFLVHLSTLPPNHPLNNMDMSTHLEIALNREDGSVVRMGITKTSGVTMFDVGALDSVKRASPFGKPPGMIVSSDGNVYFHWEFHRRPEFACSTFYARPFLLNLPQPDAPSGPSPGPTPSPSAPVAPDEKHTLFPELSPSRPRG